MAAAADDPTRRAPHDIPLGSWLVSTLAENWEPAPKVSHPAQPGAVASAAAHRAALSRRFPTATIVVPAGQAPVRANDTQYGFRPHSAYAYLSADQAEHGVLVLTPEPAGEGHQATLYLPHREGPGTPDYFTDRRRGAVWVGGIPDSVTTASALNLPVRPLVDLRGDLGRAGADVRPLRGVDPRVDALLPGATDGGVACAIDELRAVKDQWEINQLAQACAATARGFADVVGELPRLLSSGGRRGERWLEGTFWRRARYEGNEVGYSSIVAAGAHGTALHWAPVDGDVVAGQLLLADMGIEGTSFYTADITRTLPVDRRWTSRQRRVYSAVQEANRAGIGEVRAGNPFLAAHHAAQWVLADHLRHWGLFPHKPDDALHDDPARPGAGAHRRYSLHGTSHMLGLDVHDCAALPSDSYLGLRLEAGHCLTVEPGLYFQVNDLTVPPELRGLAVRIEDDVVVTDGEPQVLSAMLPTDPDEVTAWMAENQAG
jgi:Xaa-Pro aminopeptidase